MELTKSRRKRVEPVRRSFCQSATRLRHHQERNAPRMPGTGIADRYLMNPHRAWLVSRFVPTNLYILEEGL